MVLSEYALDVLIEGDSVPSEAATLTREDVIDFAVEGMLKDSFPCVRQFCDQFRFLDEQVQRLFGEAVTYDEVQLSKARVLSRRRP